MATARRAGAAAAADVYELPLPAVVGVREGINLPRYPSVPGRLRAKRRRSSGSCRRDAAGGPTLDRLQAARRAGAATSRSSGNGPEAAPRVVELLRELGRPVSGVLVLVELAGRRPGPAERRGARRSPAGSRSRSVASVDAVVVASASEADRAAAAAPRWAGTGSTVGPPRRRRPWLAAYAPAAWAAAVDRRSSTAGSYRAVVASGQRARHRGPRPCRARGSTCRWPPTSSRSSRAIRWRLDPPALGGQPARGGVPRRPAAPPDGRRRTPFRRSNRRRRPAPRDRDAGSSRRSPTRTCGRGSSVATSTAGRQGLARGRQGRRRRRSRARQRRGVRDARRAGRAARRRGRRVAGGDEPRLAAARPADRPDRDPDRTGPVHRLRHQRRDPAHRRREGGQADPRRSTPTPTRRSSAAPSYAVIGDVNAVVPAISAEIRRVRGGG